METKQKVLLYLMMIAGLIGLVAEVHPGWADKGETHEKTVRLDLGGKFCEFYPDEITDVVMALPGVKKVDAVKKRKFVMVEFDAEKAAPKEMIAAIEKLKGDRWFCAASVSEKK